MTRATIDLLYRRVPLFHHVDLRVLWADTDPAGIVWFGVFFRYFEQAEEELFRALGHDRTKLLADLGIFMPRTSLQSRFKSPARLGDEIAVGVGVSAITDRRIEYAFDIRERGTGRLICDASYRVACVEQQTFAPRAFPRQIVDLLAPALTLRERSTERDVSTEREASAERPRTR
ncbi:MAG TPA: thioesterase family protein [Vicinamibacterales bacterium]|nr:thioesterase family protein [Vicinamibacterales bacterium]